MTRITWLDGLRGLAAANSVVRHAFYMEPKSVFGFLFRSYWAEPREANRHLIELPPFRLIFASSSWVTCFMVLYGVAISIPIIQSRNLPGDKHGSWIKVVSSQATGRVFRLYLPVFCISLLSNLLFFCGLVIHPQAIQMMKRAWDLQPLEAPWAHIKFSLWQLVHLTTFVRYELDIANTLERDDLEGVLNPQLWSIPVDFRGSLAVYFLLFVTGFWRPLPRRLFFTAVAFWWFFLGQWDLFAFTSGMCVAEHLYGNTEETKGAIRLSSDSEPSDRSIGSTVNQSWNKIQSSTAFNYLWKPSAFIGGLFLMSLPDDGPLGAEYHFLLDIPTSPWWTVTEIFNRCWTGLGATLVIITIANTKWLQYPLDSQLLQYMGRISYPVYVIHFAVYFSFKWPLQNLFWYIARGEGYPGSEAACLNKGALTFTWVGSLLTCITIMIILGDLFEKHVDAIARYAGKWFEQQVTEQPK
ncbi:uncharacterized protein N7506_004325 [Penicillium brevicompactum]|uniref:uncharacterized protein n=1 Tax=Penicillium brevicompactum TaxID=5074 RepID=UPI00253FCF4B|nr:uncharacterized protein N7506_004325 [Penicillium brevicompactum]KAJ5336303.1 hypothetical protein N7506_004325 [Penicillium brevicompactum]